MFKCFDNRTGSEIIILDPEWMGERLGELRAKGREKMLLCPGCRQPVLVRAGEIRAWHFAHQELSACPLQTESAAVLKARRLLYHWLCARFVDRVGVDPGQKNVVSVEKDLANNLPRPCDCYVETSKGQRIAYWIVERNVRDRNLFVRGVQGVMFRFVFLKSMLRPAKDEENAFDLTMTERELTDRSAYDQLYGGHLGSLHYLDEETEHLMTLRGVRLVHAPQRYHCRAMLNHKLDQVQTFWTGEFIHPGEHDGLKKLQNEEPYRKKRAPLVCEESLQNQYASTQNTDRLARASWAKWLAERKQQKAQLEADGSPEQEVCVEMTLEQRRAKGEEPMTCQKCGKLTTEWVHAKPSEGTCVCRECNQALWDEKRTEQPQ